MGYKKTFIVCQINNKTGRISKLNFAITTRADFQATCKVEISLSQTPHLLGEVSVRKKRARTREREGAPSASFSRGFFFWLVPTGNLEQGKYFLPFFCFIKYFNTSNYLKVV